MKATMNHPAADYLAAYKLSANDLEKVTGAIDTYEKHEYLIYALTQATLTIYGFGSLPKFTDYVNEMRDKEDIVTSIMYASFPKEQALIAITTVTRYKYMHDADKCELLYKVYNKFV